MKNRLDNLYPEISFSQMQIPKDQNILIIKVIPNAQKTEIVGYMTDGTLKIRLHALPENGKANEMLLGLLSEVTGEKWQITHGIHSSRKTASRL